MEFDPKHKKPFFFEALMQPKTIDREGSGIKITWDDEKVTQYTGEFLRKHCPCALCKETPGHPPPQPIPEGKVEVRSASPMGWYALQLTFSDAHDSGIYTYELLRELGGEKLGSS